MEDNILYQIQLQGRVEVDELNTTGPLQMDLVCKQVESTHFDVTTDQSGLVGLLRYLHSRGVVFLSIQKLDP